MGLIEMRNALATELFGEVAEISGNPVDIGVGCQVRSLLRTVLDGAVDEGGAETVRGGMIKITIVRRHHQAFLPIHGMNKVDLDQKMQL